MCWALQRPIPDAALDKVGHSDELHHKGLTMCIPTSSAVTGVPFPVLGWTLSERPSLSNLASRTVDFQLDISIDQDPIELMDETKMLDVIVSSDLKWKKNTEYLNPEDTQDFGWLNGWRNLDTYIKQVRSIMEMACPIWHPALTKADSRALERVQMSALAIILGELALKFVSPPVPIKWFKKVDDVPDTRMKNSYQPVWTRTTENHPFLTWLISWMHTIELGNKPYVKQ